MLLYKCTYKFYGPRILMVVVFLHDDAGSLYKYYYAAPLNGAVVFSCVINCNKLIYPDIQSILLPGAHNSQCEIE